MRVLVLGCGPAGLLAAEAASRFTDDITIFSKKVKSVMPGAQFLHKPIPEVTPDEPTAMITMRKLGEKSVYAEKVYGDPHAAVSWDNYAEGEIPAWSMFDAYEVLWDRWGGLVQEKELNHHDIRHEFPGQWDVIFSTVPAWVGCCNGGRTGSHHFRSTNVYIVPKADDTLPDNTIVYNGSRIGGWYRMSKIFGHGSTEYGMRVKVPDAKEYFKPTYTNCTCTPPNVVPLGRFGQWDKKVLVHEAFEGARDALLAVQ